MQKAFEFLPRDPLQKCPCFQTAFTAIKMKKGQSVWNFPPRHLGSCLNCKYVGTKRSAYCCYWITHSFGRTAKCVRSYMRVSVCMCVRGFLRGPKLHSAVSPTPPWSMASTQMSQVPHWVSESPRKQSAISLNNINIWSKVIGLHGGGSVFS